MIMASSSSDGAGRGRLRLLLSLLPPAKADSPGYLGPQAVGNVPVAKPTRCRL